MGEHYTRIVTEDGRHGTVMQDSRGLKSASVMFDDSGYKTAPLSSLKWSYESEADTIAHVAGKMSRYSAKNVVPLGITGRPPIRSEASARAMDARHHSAFRRDFPPTPKRSVTQRLVEGLAILESVHELARA